MTETSGVGLLGLREGLLSFTFRLALGLFFAFALALSLPVMRFAMRDRLLHKGPVGPVGPCSMEFWFAEHLHAVKYV